MPRKKQLDEHLARNDDKFDRKIEKAITKLDENFSEKLKSGIEPLEERLVTSEGQIEVLKVQMEKYSETQEAINKVVIESNTQLTKALTQIHTNTNSILHDPNTSHLRQKLSEELQRENCVLTIQGCTETVDGKTGWLLLLEQLTFRNGYDSSKFNSGILRTIQLPKEVGFTTVPLHRKIKEIFFAGTWKRKINHSSSLIHTHNHTDSPTRT